MPLMMEPNIKNKRKSNRKKHKLFLASKILHFKFCFVYFLFLHSKNNETNKRKNSSKSITYVWCHCDYWWWSSLNEQKFSWKKIKKSKSIIKINQIISNIKWTNKQTAKHWWNDEKWNKKYFKMMGFHI